MKSKLTVLSLNLWGGMKKKELLDAIRRWKDSVDVFCFQEVFSNATKMFNEQEMTGMCTSIYQEISAVLNEAHSGFFDSAQFDEQGIAMFIRDTISIGDIHSSVIFGRRNGWVPGKPGTAARTIQTISLVGIGDEKFNEAVSVSHLHGLWNGKGKTDCRERFVQSWLINQHLKKVASKTALLCGDFNLLPENKSFVSIAKSFDIDLINRYDIKSTRTPLYNKPTVPQYADYMFARGEVAVETFMVDSDFAGSDHAPLYAVFAIG